MRALATVAAVAPLGAAALALQAAAYPWQYPWQPASARPSVLLEAIAAAPPRLRGGGCHADVDPPPPGWAARLVRAVERALQGPPVYCNLDPGSADPYARVTVNVGPAGRVTHAVRQWRVASAAEAARAVDSVVARALARPATTTVWCSLDTVPRPARADAPRPTGLVRPAWVVRPAGFGLGVQGPGYQAIVSAWAQPGGAYGMQVEATATWFVACDPGRRRTGRPGGSAPAA